MTQIEGHIPSWSLVEEKGKSASGSGEVWCYCEEVIEQWDAISYCREDSTGQIEKNEIEMSEGDTGR